MTRMSTALQPGEINLGLIPIQWPLTPVSGSKNPYLKGWQKKPQTVDDIKKEIEKPDSECRAVGLISGPVYNDPYGLIWVDIDGPTVWKKIDELSKLPISEALPPTLTILSGREGRERKLYKLSKRNWKYLARNKYNWPAEGDGEKLEVLWKRHQGVLMGKHPQTDGYFTKDGEDFKHAADLPEIPQWILNELEIKNLKQGRPKEITTRTFGQNFAFNTKFDHDTDIKEAVKALWKLDPAYADDHEKWITMGMVLHSVDDVLLEEWEKWSMQSEKYKPGECHAKWLSFTKEGGVGLGTLIHEAKKYGYEPPQQSPRPSPQPVPDETLDQFSNLMTELLQNDPDMPPEVLLDSVNLISNKKSFSNNKAPHTPGKRKNATENLIAQALIKQWDGKALFDTTTNKFHWYEEKRRGLWSALTPSQMEKKIEDELDRLSDILIPNGCGNKTIENLYKWLKRSLEHEEWNPNKNLILFTNGVYDLETGNLGVFNKDHYISRSVPYDYDPQATCEPIVTWLGEIMDGDYQKVQLLRAWMRAVLVSASELQKFVEITGPGKSGKSSFTNLCHALVGFDNATVSTLERLNTNRFELSKLPGKKLLLFNDVERYGGGVSTLKVLTGNDLANSEHKFKSEEATFKFDGLIMITANEKIQTTDQTSGLFRRRISIPFNVPFKGGPKEQKVLINCDRNRTTGEFVPYLPGLINWLLQMSEDDMREYLLDTNNKVTSYRKITQEQMLKANPIMDWLHHNVIWDLGAKCVIGNAKPAPNRQLVDKELPSFYAGADKKLFANFSEFCRDNGHNAMKRSRFEDLLLDALQNQLNLNVRLNGLRTPSVLNIMLRPGANDPKYGTHNQYPSPVELGTNLEKHEQFYRDQYPGQDISIRFKQ